KIVYGILRKELLELPVQLSRQGLVVAQYQRWPLRLLYDIGNSKSLAGPGYPEQGLVFFTGVHTLHQLTDGFRLITGRRIFRRKFKFHGISTIKPRKTWFV